MIWIKQNIFLFSLAVVTLLVALVLWVLGSKAAANYKQAKQDYDSAYAEVMSFEKLDPYPTDEHLESKKLAVTAYSGQTDELQKTFAPYRPEDLKNITVQAFSSAVKQANKETRTAFGENLQIPEDYFCGFEEYSTSLPAGSATGILNYQLEVTKKLMLNLAASGASELVSLHRPELPEEEGKSFKPENGQVARALPLEVVFKGPEKAVRDFLSSLVNDKDHYLVVRSLKVANEKQIPPRKSDVRFSGGDRRRAQPDEANNAAFEFSALFGEGEPVAPAPDATGEVATPGGVAASAPLPAPAPLGLPGDTSRVLAQVLGQEELQVFIRLDVLLFLEPAPLP